MIRRQRQRGQIMLIILGTLFLGSGTATGVFTSGKSIQSIRKEAKALRLDDARQAKVYALLDQWESIAQPAADEFDTYGQDLTALMKRRTASPEEFRAILEPQRATALDAERRLLPLRDELRAALTAEEWNRLFR